MSLNVLSLAFTGYLALAACAAVIALVLEALYRSYRRPYLRHWAASWWAFCLYLVGTAALVPGLANVAPALHLAVSTLAFAGGYFQVAWLLAGTWEVATGRQVGRRRLGWTLALLAGLAFATAAATDFGRPGVHLLVRIGLR